MPKLDLRIRDLKSGEILHAAFDREADALVWLADRPRYVEVMGVATHGLPRELYSALRAACRPMDAEEEALEAVLEQAADEAARVEAEAAKKAEAAEAVAHREAMKVADPDRPMAIAWTVEDGMRLVDSADPRTITDAAREAVMAWIAEREGWVTERGKTVTEATVTVWPGPLPRGRTERVHAGGTFVALPVATPTVP